MKPVNFFCPDCNAPHFDNPALTLARPDAVNECMQKGSRHRIEIGSEICRILNPKPRRNFVRANLVVPVNDHGKDLDYGAWVELTDDCFGKYRNNERLTSSIMFEGTLANAIPGFEDSHGATVYLMTRPPSLRPIFRPVEAISCFYRDCEQGISSREAELRVDSWLLATQTTRAA